MKQVAGKTKDISWVTKKARIQSITFLVTDNRLKKFKILLPMHLCYLSMLSYCSESCHRLTVVLPALVRACTAASYIASH